MITKLLHTYIDNRTVTIQIVLDKITRLLHTTSLFQFYLLSAGGALHGVLLAAACCNFQEACRGELL